MSRCASLHKTLLHVSCSVFRRVFQTTFGETERVVIVVQETLDKLKSSSGVLAIILTDLDAPSCTRPQTWTSLPRSCTVGFCPLRDTCSRFKDLSECA